MAPRAMASLPSRTSSPPADPSAACAWGFPYLKINMVKGKNLGTDLFNLSILLSLDMRKGISYINPLERVKYFSSVYQKRLPRTGKE
jgi:hypothetical protein